MCVCIYTDVSLTVPGDAVMFNMQHPYQLQHQQQVFVGVSRDDTHRPKLTGNFYLLTAFLTIHRYVSVITFVYCTVCSIQCRFDLAIIHRLCY